MKLTDAIAQMDIADIYRTFHTNTEDYMFFLEPHGTFFSSNAKNTHDTTHNHMLLKKLDQNVDAPAFRRASSCKRK